MRTGSGLSKVNWRSWVRRVLSSGRPARVAAGAVVALAGIVWLAAAAAVLRALVVVALLVAAAWCLWLVRAAWATRAWDEDDGPVPSQPDWTQLRDALARWIAPQATADGDPFGGGSTGWTPAAESDALERLQRVLDAHDATVVALRRSVDALEHDVLGRQERLAADSERLTRDLTAGVEAMRGLLAQIERGDVPTPPAAPAGARAPLPAADLPAEDDELDFEAVYRDLEADLRLEAVLAREQTLAEQEERLNRRERELAVFVAQAQSRLE